jgi:hypothetical protein
MLIQAGFLLLRYFILFKIRAHKYIYVGDFNIVINTEKFKIKYILAYLLKARTVKPAETVVARERLCKHSRC